MASWEDSLEPKPEPEPTGAELAIVRDPTKYDAERPKPKELAVRKSYTPDAHRLLPQSPDAEKGVLSSCLIAPLEIIGLCIEKQITPEWFFIPAHAGIFSTLLDMYEQNDRIDFITLTQFLRDIGKLDLCGGAAFITELFTFLPTAANASYYIEILKEKRVNRALIKVCTEFAGRGYDEQDNPDLLDQAETAILSIKGNSQSDTCSIAKPLVVQAIGIIETAYERRGTISGLATGFSEFDKMTDGLQKAEFSIIAGRPSMGKTALAMNIAEFIAVDLKKAVLVFSLEMSKQQLMTRFLCSRARVNLMRVREGFLSERDFPALQMAASKFAESKLFIDDQSGLSIQEIRARARRLKNKYDIQAIFIDYLQLAKSNTKRAQENRVQEVSEVSGGCKEMAKELHLPVVVCAQLGRSAESRGIEGRPRLSELRESGSIEQDADLVGFINRPERYAQSDEEKEEWRGKADLIVAKNRNGPVGDVLLTFLKEYTRFETRAYETGEYEPAAAPENHLPL